MAAGLKNTDTPDVVHQCNKRPVAPVWFGEWDWSDGEEMGGWEWVGKAAGLKLFENF